MTNCQLPWNFQTGCISCGSAGKNMVVGDSKKCVECLEPDSQFRKIQTILPDWGGYPPASHVYCLNGDNCVKRNNCSKCGLNGKCGICCGAPASSDKDWICKGPSSVGFCLSPSGGCQTPFEFNKHCLKCDGTNCIKCGEALPI